MEHRRFAALRLILLAACLVLLTGSRCTMSQTARQSSESSRSVDLDATKAQSAPDSEELLQMNTMNAKFIAGLVRMLLDDEFSVADVERYLGPVVDDEHPEHVKLDSRLEDLEDLTVAWDDKTDPVFVHTIVAYYAEPTKLDTGLLLKEFGEPRVGPRLKPHDPFPYMMSVSGKRYEGNLLLNVEGQNWRRDPVVRVRLTRIAPEPANPTDLPELAEQE